MSRENHKNVNQLMFSAKAYMYGANGRSILLNYQRKRTAAPPPASKAEAVIIGGMKGGARVRINPNAL